MSRSFVVIAAVLLALVLTVWLGNDTLVKVAAEQGYAPAQFHLGFMYEYGQGMPQDDEQAAHWYRKAAEQGDADAQFSLGILYLIGQGVQQDTVLAYVSFGIAASRGDEQSMANRDRLAARMTPEQIAEGEALISEWQPGNPLPLKSVTGIRGQVPEDSGQMSEDRDQGSEDRDQGSEDRS